MAFDATSTYTGAIGSGDTGSANLMNSLYAQKTAFASLPDPGNAGVLGLSTDGVGGASGPTAVYRDNGTSYEFLGTLKGVIGVKLDTTGNQSIGDMSLTAVNFGAEVFDSSVFHDNTTANSRITIPDGLSGKYLVAAGFGVTSLLSGAYNLQGHIITNATTTEAADSITGVASDAEILLHSSISTILDLSSGDYVELYILVDENGLSETITHQRLEAWKLD